MIDIGATKEPRDGSDHRRARSHLRRGPLHQVEVEVERPAGDAGPAEVVLDALARAQAQLAELRGVGQKLVDGGGEVAGELRGIPGLEVRGADRLEGDE